MKLAALAPHRGCRAGVKDEEFKNEPYYHLLIVLAPAALSSRNGGRQVDVRTAAVHAWRNSGVLRRPFSLLIPTPSIWLMKDLSLGEKEPMLQLLAAIASGGALE